MAFERVVGVGKVLFGLIVQPVIRFNPVIESVPAPFRIGHRPLDRLSHGVLFLFGRHRSHRKIEGFCKLLSCIKIRSV